MLLALLGCGHDAAEHDRARYASVLRSPTPAAATLARCKEIQDPALAGDCSLVVIAAAEAAPGTLCGEVPEGMWREECWFLAAEAINRSGDALLAAQMCQRSGRFAMDCAQHLWQTPVHTLIHEPGAAAFATALPQAEALYSAWSPMMDEQTDFAERFWSKFFGNGFEGQGLPVDLRWCEPVSLPHQEDCIAAGVAHYTREIGPHIERSGGLKEVCDLTTHDVSSLSRWIAAVPDQRLDAAAAERVRHICSTHPHLQRR
jgi:hypothetical protein